MGKRIEEKHPEMENKFLFVFLIFPYHVTENIDFIFFLLHFTCLIIDHFSRQWFDKSLLMKHLLRYNERMLNFYLKFQAQLILTRRMFYISSFCIQWTIEINLWTSRFSSRSIGHSVLLFEIWMEKFKGIEWLVYEI